MTAMVGEAEVQALAERMTEAAQYMTTMRIYAAWLLRGEASARELLEARKNLNEERSEKDAAYDLLTDPDFVNREAPIVKESALCQAVIAAESQIAELKEKLEGWEDERDDLIGDRDQWKRHYDESKAQIAELRAANAALVKALEDTEYQLCAHIGLRDIIRDTLGVVRAALSSHKSAAEKLIGEVKK